MRVESACGHLKRYWNFSYSVANLCFKICAIITTTTTTTMGTLSGRRTMRSVVCRVSMFNRPKRVQPGWGRCHNSGTCPKPTPNPDADATLKCMPFHFYHLYNACQPPTNIPLPRSTRGLCIYEKSLKLLHLACWHLVPARTHNNSWHLCGD